jgi:hypothetical protein
MVPGVPEIRAGTVIGEARFPTSGSLSAWVQTFIMPEAGTTGNGRVVSHYPLNRFNGTRPLPASSWC